MESATAKILSRFSTIRERTLRDLIAEKASLLTFIRRRTRNSGDAEDIYQEAMERLTRKLHSGAMPDNPLGYVYRVTANLINDLQRQPPPPTETLDDVTESLTCQQPQPDQQLNDQQHFAMFVKQLNDLPVALRTMIVLSKVHGVSNRQIGVQFGLSAKTVEKQINRAIKNIEVRMAQILEPQE